MSELSTAIQYMNDEPTLLLTPKRARTLNNAVVAIPLQEMFAWYAPEDPAGVARLATQVCVQLDLGEPTPKRLYDIITTVHDAIDELVATAPDEELERERNQVIGKGKIMIDGEAYEFPVTKGMLI